MRVATDIVYPGTKSAQRDLPHHEDPMCGEATGSVWAVGQFLMGLNPLLYAVPTGRRIEQQSLQGSLVGQFDSSDTMTQNGNRSTAQLT